MVIIIGTLFALHEASISEILNKNDSLQLVFYVALKTLSRQKWRTSNKNTHDKDLLWRFGEILWSLYGPCWIKLPVGIVFVFSKTMDYQERRDDYKVTGVYYQTKLTLALRLKSDWRLSVEDVVYWLSSKLSSLLYLQLTLIKSPSGRIQPSFITCLGQHQVLAPRSSSFLHLSQAFWSKFFN